MAESGTGNPFVTAALGEMAILRQADVSDVTLDLYTAKLAESEIAVVHVLEACAQIGSEPRREGETAFPSMGVLLERCRKVERDAETARRKALAAQGEQFALPAHDAPRLTQEEAAAFIERLKADVEAQRGKAKA